MTRTVERPAETPAPPGKRQRRFPLVAVLLLAALAVTLAGIFPFRQMIAQQRQVDQTQARLDSLLAQNSRLEETVAALSSPAGVERLAREEYGLVRPGETGYTVDVPEGEPDAAAAPPADDQVLDDRTLLERFWDFLTGRDLVPDE